MSDGLFAPNKDGAILVGGHREIAAGGNPTDFPVVQRNHQRRLERQTVGMCKWEYVNEHWEFVNDHWEFGNM